MKRTVGYIATLTLLLVYFGCRKSFEKPAWDVDILMPIAKTSLSVTNLIQDSLLQVNIDNSLTIVYNSSIFTLTLDSLTEIPDTTVQEDYLWTFGTTTLLPGFELWAGTEDTKYDLNDVELVFVIVRSGSIKIHMESSIDEELEIKYELPLATISGNPFSVVERVPANGQLDRTYDLSGYHLDLRGTNLNDVNTIATAYVIKIPNDGNSVQVVNGDNVKIINTFAGIIPEYARGYFGQVTHTVMPTIENTNLFNNFTTGTLDLEQVDLVFSITNEVGVDLQATLNTLKSINPANNSTVDLQHAIIGNTINMTRATENTSNNYPPIDPVVYSFTMDNNNSNADEFIENLPDQLEYSMELVINPLGNTSGNNDFIYFGTGIDFNLDMEMSLSFIANSLTLIDTTEFFFADRPQPDEDGEIKNPYPVDGYLYLYAYNGFPFSATIQLYTLDSNYTVLDSLISGGSTVTAAPLDITNKVISKQQTKVIIPVNAGIIDKLYDTRYVIMKVSFTTAGQPSYTKIYSEYGIDLKLIGDFTYNIDMD